MPASMHPACAHPENKAAKIWRYMDFTKYVSMLEHSGLYFCRADQLGDPFEGSYPEANVIDVTKNPLAKLFDEMHNPERAAERAVSRLSDLRRIAIKMIFLSCWHMNEYESAAMWKLYAKSDEAIVIQSTFERLFDALDEGSHVGLVNYIDYETGTIGSDNILYAFFHKRKSFEHEQELRALHWNIPESDEALRKEPPIGIWKTVDLNKLLLNVYVSPATPTWYRELVEAVTRKYGLATPVSQSVMDAKPLF